MSKIKKLKFENIRFDTRFLVFITLGILIFFNLSNYLILIYYFFQKDLIFSPTSRFPIFETIHWYYIFFGLITLQMLIVFLTYRFTKHMKNFSFVTEKQKIIALYLLIGVNLLTIPMNLPLIWSFFAYRKGSEILYQHWGNFRRILNENETEKLYQETVKNFLEKIEVSKEIQDALTIFASENTKCFLKKYEDGSSFATKYVYEQLKIQQEFLQREAVKNADTIIQIADCVDNTAKNQQSWFSWIYDQTMRGFNYLTTDSEVLAWLFVILGISIIIYAISSTPGNTPANIPAQADEIINLKSQVSKMDAILELVPSLGDPTVLTEDHLYLMGQMTEALQEIRSICRRIADPRGIVLPDWIPPVPLAEEKKAELIAKILQDYEGPQSVSTNMALEVVQNLITNF